MALERNTGARGLRAIIENAMTEIMYEIPSRADVACVEITPACIRKTGSCIYHLKREEVTAEESKG
jgi:ATP-dependent Clp protease ATP-binding subunit ClpX